MVLSRSLLNKCFKKSNLITHKHINCTISNKVGYMCKSRRGRGGIGHTQQKLATTYIEVHQANTMRNAILPSNPGEVNNNFV